MNFWYMQLHPTNDPKYYSPERMLEVVHKWRDVGMGDDRQWTEGGENIRKQFRSVMQIGDIVALGHGQRIFALVRIAGDVEDNSVTRDHWYGLKRQVEILCDDALPYLNAYARENGKLAIDGLNLRTTLTRILKNEFVPWWYERVSSGGVVLQDSDVVVDSSAHQRVRVATSSEWYRSSRVVERALAVGKCELCGKDRTFTKSGGGQYMEAHHLVWMSRQSRFACNLDVPSNVVCLCPQCHRFLHSGVKSEIRQALNRLYQLRADSLSKAGIAKSFDEFAAAALKD